ncbi:hypothetical protein GGR56DRAFT_678298 [Xylariaceae sp. FL0804]|nr:hypothetical protein GGR56DRAFT_678298 [Xylariaceae sp. FL0804]
MASSAPTSTPPPEGSSKRHFPADSSLPGERFEVRQTHPSGDYAPDPSKSFPLSPQRQALVDDVVALYEMKPTVERVKRYTPDCVYNDQFVYANDRYKMAGQWFALPKLFKGAKSHGVQVVTNDRDLIQFRHQEEWTFKVIPKTAVVNAIVSLSLDPDSIDTDFIRIKFHKDQANDKDYSNEGLGATFKKWQADNVSKHMDSPEVAEFEADKNADMAAAAAASSSSDALPPTHAALVLHSVRDPYDLSVTADRPTPAAAPGSAVVRVLATMVLTYSGRVFRGDKPYAYPTPSVPGLAAVGRVAAAGPDAVSALRRPGLLVFVDCFVRGRDQPDALILSGLSAGRCEASRRLAEGEWRDGSYAEYVKVPLENCYALDESRLLGDPAQGGLGYKVENLAYMAELAVPFGGLRDVGVKAGDKVIVAPASGAFGSAAVLGALALGARVVAMGRNRETLEPLTKLGPEGRVTIALNTGDVEADAKKLLEDGPADVFYDISPGAALRSTHFKSCTLALRRGGRVSLQGAHHELAFPMAAVMFNDITIKGKWMYERADLRLMIRLVELGYLKLGAAGGIRLVGAFPLARFADAFEAAANMDGPCQHVVITP